MSAPRFVVLVTEYLALRRSLGFDLKSCGWVLLAFARHLDEIGHRGPLTVDLATRWAASCDSSDPCNAARRLASVRQFARHIVAFEPATEVPPAGLLGRGAIRKPPHIYSDAEVSALLWEARLLQPRDGLRPLIRPGAQVRSLVLLTAWRRLQGKPDPLRVEADATATSTYPDTPTCRSASSTATSIPSS